MPASVIVNGNRGSTRTDRVEFNQGKRGDESCSCICRHMARKLAAAAGPDQPFGVTRARAQVAERSAEAIQVQENDAVGLSSTFVFDSAACSGAALTAQSSMQSRSASPPIRADQLLISVEVASQQLERKHCDGSIDAAFMIQSSYGSVPRVW